MRDETDRAFGHLMKMRQLKGLRGDEKRRKLVDTLHVNLDNGGDSGFVDDTWCMPELNHDRRTGVVIT